MRAHRTLSSRGTGCIHTVPFRLSLSVFPLSHLISSCMQMAPARMRSFLIGVADFPDGRRYASAYVEIPSRFTEIREPFLKTCRFAIHTKSVTRFFCCFGNELIHAFRSSWRIFCVSFLSSLSGYLNATVKRGEWYDVPEMRTSTKVMPGKAR